MTELNRSNYDDIYGDLMLLERHLQGRIRQYLDVHALDQDSFRCLAFIGDHGGCRSADLLAALGLDRAALNRKLSLIGGQGFILKKPCKADSRAYTLHLTPAGRAILEAVEEITRRWNDELRGALDDRDYASLSCAVKKLSAYSLAQSAQPDTLERWLV